MATRTIRKQSPVCAVGFPRAVITDANKGRKRYAVPVESCHFKCSLLSSGAVFTITGAALPASIPAPTSI